MKFKLLTIASVVAALGLTAVTSVTSVTAASHGMSAEEAYAARVELMRGMGRTMRTLSTLEGQEMVDAANLYMESFGRLASLFPEGSNVGDSRALPVIWEDFSAVEAVIAKGIDAATVLAAAAEAGDQAAFAAAGQALGAVCGECHGNFRAQE